MLRNPSKVCAVLSARVTFEVARWPVRLREAKTNFSSGVEGIGKRGNSKFERTAMKKFFSAIIFLLCLGSMPLLFSFDAGETRFKGKVKSMTEVEFAGIDSAGTI